MTRPSPAQRPARLRSFLDVDEAVLWGVLNNGRGLLFAPVVAVAIAASLTPELQGYYYAFNGLVAVLALADGIGAVLVQSASRAAASLRLDGEVAQGPPGDLAALAGVAQSGLRTFAAAGIVAGLAVGSVGGWFLGKGGTELAWLAPWVALCVATAANVALVPVWAVLDGCGLVAWTMRARLLRGVAFSATVVAALLLGAGLWAAPLGWLGALAVAWGSLLGRPRRLLRILLRHPSPRPLPAGHAAWQLHGAVAWAAQSLPFLLLAPLTLGPLGPAEAGRLGMSATLAVAVTGVASAWLWARAPELGRLAAAGDRAQLATRFRRNAGASMAVAGAGFAAVLLAVLALAAAGSPLANRLLPPVSLGVLLLAVLAAHASVPLAVLLRAHGAEPLAVPAAVSVLAMLALAAAAAPGGTLAVAGAAAVVFAGLGLPWQLAVWRRWRAAHAVAPLASRKPEIPT